MRKEHKKIIISIRTSCSSEVRRRVRFAYPIWVCFRDPFGVPLPIVSASCNVFLDLLSLFASELVETFDVPGFPGFYSDILRYFLELFCAGRPRADVWEEHYFEGMLNCFLDSVGSIGMCFDKEMLIGRICPEGCTDGFRTPLAT